MPTRTSMHRLHLSKNQLHVAIICYKPNFFFKFPVHRSPAIFLLSRPTKRRPFWSSDQGGVALASFENDIKIQPARTLCSSMAAAIRKTQDPRTIALSRVSTRVNLLMDYVTHTAAFRHTQMLQTHVQHMMR